MYVLCTCTYKNLGLVNNICQVVMRARVSTSLTSVPHLDNSGPFLGPSLCGGFRLE